MVQVFSELFIVENRSFIENVRIGTLCKNTGITKELIMNGLKIKNEWY